MVLPLISFNPPTRPTTSRYSQIDSQMFLDSILKEVDTQAEKFFTKFISLHLNISTFWMLLIFISINPVTWSTTSRKGQIVYHYWTNHIEAVIDLHTKKRLLQKLLLLVECSKIVLILVSINLATRPTTFSSQILDQSKSK